MFGLRRLIGKDKRVVPEDKDIAPLEKSPKDPALSEISANAVEAVTSGPTSIDEDPYQKGLVITDDIAMDPILDFNLYRNAIVNIIRNSYPKFTIGIFGDWGTGKTTLMNSIERALQKDNNLIVVRFESWRYEREDQFALVPLLKTIAFALPDDPVFQSLKHKLKTGGITFLKKTPEIVSSIVSKQLGEEAGAVMQTAIDSFRGQINSKVDLLAEVDRDTLYFDGFEDVRNEISRIRRSQLRGPAFRIVVFVDDLDRCSPKKTLEVLESIKVFLGMDGIIYILGISHDVVSKLIDIEYEKSGVKGEQYIKKLIQIPITLPKWDNQDIINLVKDFVKKGTIHDIYKKDIDENIELISTAIENNPREIKRFLNNFIVAHEIFSPSNKVVPKELLVIQAVQLRWAKFYDLLIKSDENFRMELKKYVGMKDEARSANLESKEIKENEKYDLVVRRLLRNFKEDSELWNFLTKNFDTLNGIKDWKIYRRATEVSIEPTKPKTEGTNKAIKLLLTRQIDEFNNKAKELGAQLAGVDLAGADLTEFNLVDADLTGANLSNAYLTMIKLMGAKLRGANMSRGYIRDADLTEADLRGVDFTEADLTQAKLGRADLRGADLSNANLTGATLTDAQLAQANLNGVSLYGGIMVRTNFTDTKLTGAKLTGSILTGSTFTGTNLARVRLSGAKLDKSIIINPKEYDDLILDEKTNFYDAIIDDGEFIDYISRFTKIVPKKIGSKGQLKTKLIAAGIEESDIGELLQNSVLPE